MDSKFANVYKTDNYKKFKKMLDNREVSKQRITSIIRRVQNLTIQTQPSCL